MTEKLDKSLYPPSDMGNFYVKDTIGVPHPYCIGARHVVYVSDHRGRKLSAEANEASGVPCQMKTSWGGNCQLTYDEHETALLIACKIEMKHTDGTVVSELLEFLLAIKDQCESDGYAGFAFIKA